MTTLGDILNTALIETFGLYLGIGGLILWMCYIMYKLAQESGAGKTGTVVIFAVLGLGIFGFAVKGVIQLLIGADMNS